MLSGQASETLHVRSDEDLACKQADVADRHMNLKFMRRFSERERLISLKKTDVRFSCVCPVIDYKFRHNIVKVAVDPRGDSRMGP